MLHVTQALSLECLHGLRWLRRTESLANPLRAASLASQLRESILVDLMHAGDMLTNLVGCQAELAPKVRRDAVNRIESE